MSMVYRAFKKAAVNINIFMGTVWIALSVFHLKLVFFFFLFSVCTLYIYFFSHSFVCSVPFESIWICKWALKFVHLIYIAFVASMLLLLFLSLFNLFFRPLYAECSSHQIWICTKYIHYQLENCFRVKQKMQAKLKQQNWKRKWKKCISSAVAAIFVVVICVYMCVCVPFSYCITYNYQ